jgi:hypothetical protein
MTEEKQKVNGVQVFSATKFRDREAMSNVITRWLRNNPELEIVERVVRQSSDREFHCLSIVLFYHDPNAA